MKLRSWTFGAWLLTLAALSFTACGKGSSNLKWGTILGLTGDGAAYGQKMERGFQVALDEINGHGGVAGKTVQLSTEDSQFDPVKAVTAYRKLTGAEGIQIIVGITGSKNAIPVCEAAKTDPVVIVDALSSAPKISTVCGDNYFRIMASDALAGTYNANWALGDGAKKLAIVYMEDDWGTSYRDAVVSFLSQKGIQAPPSYGVTAGSRDFRSQVERIKADAPDAIFLLLYAREGSAFMQQLRQAGVTAQVYGSDNISSPEFAVAGPAVIEGVRVALPAPAKGPLYDAFVKMYRAKFNEDPDANVMKSYDALKLVATVVGEVGSDPAKIAARLKAPDFSFPGVTGTIRFNSHGDLVSQEYARLVYHSGKLEPLP